MARRNPRHAAPSPVDRIEPALGFLTSLLEPGLSLAGTVTLTLTLIVTFYVGVTGTFDIGGVLITLASVAAVVAVLVLALNHWQRKR